MSSRSKDNFLPEADGCNACEDSKLRHTDACANIPDPDKPKQLPANHDKSRFSVIIPLYNKAAEIERALRSVLAQTLAQTLAPFEIVVVDDGSTDGSAAVVEKIIAETAVQPQQPQPQQPQQQPRNNSNAGKSPHALETGTSGKGSEADATKKKSDAVTSRNYREADPFHSDPGAGTEPDNSNAGAPVIKLIVQRNAGETAARNRGMAEATGDYFALLDADDEWRPQFLETIAGLIEEFPAAGIYCTGFDIVRGGKATPGRTPLQRGVVADYFEESMTRFVATASSAVLPRAVVDRVGGFPEGMRLGGDQYMWTKIALAYPVAFTPERLAVVHASAGNRSAAIYTPEKTAYSFRDFLDSGTSGSSGTSDASDTPGDRNGQKDTGTEKNGNTGNKNANNKSPGQQNSIFDEYIARIELGKAISATTRGATGEGLETERTTAFNHRSRRLWWRLWLLNRLPPKWRPTANGLYTRIAWAVSKKGV